MKFLCMNCDAQMKLIQTVAPDQGSGISVVYGCPDCGNRIGMLTNPWETQVVSSLGVKIGGKTVDEVGASGDDPLRGCPFGEVVRQMVPAGSGGESPESPSNGSAFPESADVPSAPPGDAAANAPSGDPVWTEEAATRLANIPEFIRPMARQGIEQYAKSHGVQSIDEKVLDEAKAAFGM